MRLNKLDAIIYTIIGSFLNWCFSSPSPPLLQIPADVAASQTTAWNAVDQNFRENDSWEGLAIDDFRQIPHSRRN